MGKQRPKKNNTKEKVQRRYTAGLSSLWAQRSWQHLRSRHHQFLCFSSFPSFLLVGTSSSFVSPSLNGLSPGTHMQAWSPHHWTFYWHLEDTGATSLVDKTGHSSAGLVPIIFIINGRPTMANTQNEETHQNHEQRTSETVHSTPYWTSWSGEPALSWAARWTLEEMGEKTMLAKLTSIMSSSSHLLHQTVETLSSSMICKEKHLSI